MLDLILEELATFEMHASLEEEDGNLEVEACRCLPACDSVSYDAEVLKSNFDSKSFKKNILPSFPDIEFDEDDDER